MFYSIVVVMLFSLLIQSLWGERRGIDCKPFHIIKKKGTKLLRTAFTREKMVKKDSRCFSGNDIIQMPFQEIQFKMAVFMHSMQLVFCFVLCISPASYPRIIL